MTSASPTGRGRRAPLGPLPTDVGADDGAADNGSQHRARVRTFKPRRRALSASQQKRFDDLAPRWVIPVGRGTLDLAEVFGNDRPVVLDIGVGHGESCTEMACGAPELNVIGIDVHTPGIARVLNAIDQRHIHNLRAYHGDAFDLLERLDVGSIEGIRAFFPDPWPKARHHRRRLITSDRLEILVGVLRPGGWLHIATDIDDYVDQVVEVCSPRPDLVGGVIDRPAERPLTRYERRGIEEGRRITDLRYDKPSPRAI